jgi:hypothetical protein
MTTQLARLVDHARISRLALIGLAKNVGKTTTANHLVATLLSEGMYRADELAMTSLGLDGETTDVMTALPKPRYVPHAGMLVATTSDLLSQAEEEGMRVTRLRQLPARTALGPVVLARVERAGRIVIAGPTLLRDVGVALEQLRAYGARLGIVDGAINRLGAASPAITDACLICTGASVGANASLVARRTADVFERLSLAQTLLMDAYEKYLPGERLLMLRPRAGEMDARPFVGPPEPASEAAWMVAQMPGSPDAHFLLRGAFSEELARELLARLSSSSTVCHAEAIVADGTRIFCHAAVIRRLAMRGLHLRVGHAIRILALTINPFTPEYSCTPQELLDALLKELPEERPPVIDVISGLAT